jgi:UDP-N-acetylglucosamine--N-acetylmuramyl-(pentapeptide) pyrophosphoryl-undecaprenol N-acetylglucosamine transferase
VRILFTGGGTGGHIFPIIAVARQLKKIYAQSSELINPDQGTFLEMFFLGAGGISKDILEKEGIRVKTILAGKIRRYFSIYNLLDLFKMPISFLQALWYLYIWMPNVIFSKGGYGAVPVVLIGWLFRIPVLIHESDTIPGLANRLAAKFAKRIAISFASAGKYFPSQKTALVGNPIRSEMVQICLSTNPADKEKARDLFNLTSQKPVILILGGSQGAQKINEIILGVLPQLLEKYQVIHQAGPKNLEQIKAILGQSLPNDYHLYAFLDENQYAAAYFLADLVISRAGAGSISEIAACAKPSILIPLPGSASDHQRENAFAYAQAGATAVLEQANLTPHLFLNEITKILDNPELAQKMSANAKNFSQPEAAQKIAQELIEMGK